MYSVKREEGGRFKSICSSESEQLPPDERSLLVFGELATVNSNVWDKVTLVTTKRQAEELRLTAVSLASTETALPGGSDHCKRTCKAMQKWLDDQITLVSGAQVKPTPPAPRPLPKSRSSSSKPVTGDKKKQENNNSQRRSSPSGDRKSSCKTLQRRKSYSTSSEGSFDDQNLSPSSHSRSVSKNSLRSTNFCYHFTAGTLKTGGRLGCSKKERKQRSYGNSRDGASIRKIAQTGKSYSSSTEGSLEGGLNRPFTHQSRPCSSDEGRYDERLRRSSSIQSTSSSIDSAGSLLLGRHVLAPRRDHGNRLYLGVIKSQKKSKRFGVVFCIPYAGHGEDECLEYCMQEVEIDDILSYTDLYRHAVCEKDDVLVPASLLQPRSGEGPRPEALIDPPYAGQPYVLAVVHKGFEPRSSRGVGSPSRKTASLVVKVAGGERTRLCVIPVGCALWIPEKQARTLYNQNCHFYDQKVNDKRDMSPFHEEHESLCMHGGPNSPGHRTDDGYADSQHSYKSWDLFPRSVDSAESGTPLAVRRRGRSSGARSRADVESNNSDGFPAMEKRSHSSSRRSGNNNFIAKRPIWQYWGRAQIPDLLDPPSHEPYIPMQVFGPTTLVNSQPNNEWPAAHFAVVNRSADVTAQNDSTRVYEAMRQIQNSSAVTKSTDISSHLSVTRSEPIASEKLLHKSLDGDDDGLTGLPLHELYRRRLLKDRKEAKNNSVHNLNRRRSTTKSIRSQ
ncbi:hypothetical protein TcWFU_001194 [Taenia crassiceps]|uniref:Uncharacterized protein n=1 Tax=Taenia crassiceps TaxID=6207 RepID=A0ABR4Q8Q0_9CEST